MATLYDSLDSDLEEEEEEEERLLSEQHGEADEDDRKKKRSKDDAPDLDYSGVTQKKKKRPTLTVEHLTGLNGLIRIPDDFKALNSKIPRDAKSAAQYTRSLMKAYHDFCFELWPQSSSTDVLLMIEQLGTKQPVKTYLQHLRDTARNRHVEHVLGREKAEKLLHELELGLRPQDPTLEYDDVLREEDPVQSSPRPVTRTANETSQTTTHPVAKRRKTIHDDSSDEEEAVFENEPTLVSPLGKKEPVPDDDVSVDAQASNEGTGDANDNDEAGETNTQDEDEPTQSLTLAQATQEVSSQEKETSPVTAKEPSRTDNPIAKRRKTIHDDSSDEEEAVFEDEPTLVNPPANKKSVPDDVSVDASNEGLMREPEEEPEPSDEASVANETNAADERRKMSQKIHRHKCRKHRPS
ncbi:hypothetical protein FisN_10Hh257 [Fistulifera solaris]|uniref:Chromosome segregation in meiosis protein 3 domain-containing protein n=1 Tax=Fistulifera solaris TaxID=1519565 RepID=A0A1Z5JXF7_FISSO|nr:hypothetical protein FisN_10Hh257 [Fistulifera solaris]|eukprot:GAX18542.1 hypothetical protein FisN_10Hh257 [Fistulifera solaris]